MRQSESWQRQRLRILGDHLQQLQNWLAAQTKARQALQQVHQVERVKFLTARQPTSCEQVQFYLRQAGEEQDLVRAFANLHRTLLQRHQAEAQALEQRIAQEMIRQN
ncbi:hypothetical protein [Spirosoma linguale]|uniref:Uncharacterized protein n=1 Tax=Spirosoma linguale (strain ATCC 33905 / DSM 74 / LMG 10896 / Claus 1) TaxID=504472 RepID=D2QDR7_SPILD|nr:hypothetical protein Slin_2172 [Spirosoma linguale DSM 74]